MVLKIVSIAFSIYTSALLGCVLGTIAAQMGASSGVSIAYGVISFIGMEWVFIKS